MSQPGCIHTVPGDNNGEGHVKTVLTTPTGGGSDMHELGSNVVVAIDRLRESGVRVVERAVEGGREFVLTGPRWRSVVYVNPVRWLGLEFVVQEDGTRLIVHQIDTDLYPIAEPGQRDFAEEIEADIVEFLEALGANQVSVRRGGSRRGSGPALVIPVSGGFYRIAKGRVIASGRMFADRSEAEDGGGYETLRAV
jgi:hypothetical protein